MYLQTNLVGVLDSYRHHIAIEENGRKVSYSELLEACNKVSAYLLNSGMGERSRIGICVGDVTEMVVCMIGTIMANCVFVPLDASLPEKRFRFMVEQARLDATIIDHQEHVEDRHVFTRTIPLTSMLNSHTEQAPAAVPNYKEEDDLYIYFTSGSTGEPKGVVGKNSSLWHFLEWEIITFAIKPGTRFSQFISPFFDAFLRDVFVPLTSGGTICVPPKDEQLFVPETLTQWINDQQINFIHCVPSVFRLFNNKHMAANGYQKLEYVLLSGERINPSELIGWYDTFGDRIQLVNLYGPTEATMISSWYMIKPQDALKTRIPVGQPISDTTMIILDKQHRPCKPLIAGELYIASRYLTNGYLNNPQLTAERFVLLEAGLPSPCMAFRTGDNARMLPDNEGVDLLGREDRMIKLRGIRIELDEIENVLGKSPGVKTAVVLYDNKLDGLFAFITTDTAAHDQVAFVQSVQRDLAGRLPMYMIPSAITLVHSMPLLSNGKINYKQLMALSENNGAIVLPINKTEERLANLWKEILNLDQVSTDKDFHTVGGNSLSMMRLMSKIFSAFNTRITLAELFANLSIQKQAVLINDKLATAAVMAESTASPNGIPSPPLIQKAAVLPYYALSSSQKRTYFLSELNRASLAYNLPLVVELEGHLESGRIEDAFKQLIHRHESLRTSFVIVGEQVMQRIAGEVTFYMEYHEGSNAVVEDILKTFVRPFDVSTAPLVRSGLIRLSDESHLLMVDIHHIITDGLSQEILIKEFMQLYNGQNLPALPLQYKDYSEWKQSQSCREQLAVQGAFWQKEFSHGVSVLDLPADHPRPLIKTYNGNNTSFTIGVAATAGLKALGEKTGATLFMTMLSVLNVLLSRLCNQEEVIVGTPVAGREHPDLDGVMGMFVNTLAIRNEVNGDLSFSEFLLAVKHKTLTCFEYQLYPYEELISLLKLPRDTSRNPLFDVMFTYQNYQQAELVIPGLRLKPYDIGHYVSKVDLDMRVRELDDELHCYIEYATDLFEKQTIERFITYFHRIVAAVTAAPETRLNEIDILSPAERDQLLHQFNSTSVPYARNKTMIDLFEEQVNKTPDRVALISGTETLTYKEFATRVDNLAAILLKKGVQPDDIIGLLCDRSLELMIGIYGILKAGAAYLPIEPGYPAKRIEALLEDSEARLLLSTSKYAGRFSQTIDVVELSATPARLTGERVRTQKAVPDNLAYVIFTSGSTGKPKGVMITHQGLGNLNKGITDIISYSGKTILSATSFSFDIFILESLLPLAHGATIVIANEEERHDPLMLNELILQHRVQMLQMTPSMMKGMVENTRLMGGLNALTDVMLGGEPFPYPLLQFFQKNTKARIFNMYGPTETTVWSTVQELTHQQQITIGTPIANTQVYILDKKQMLQPVGVTGELCISGNGIAKGYLNREQLTAEKFIAHPFKPGEKLYRTGDSARWLADGRIELLGRQDYQVKVRGHRIEPGEIESQLNSHPGIKDAAVVAKGLPGEAYLVGYYASAAEIPANKLRQYLSELLPDYMVPAQFVHLERLPLTVSGKIDRIALPEPVFAAEEDYIAPSVELEKELVRIWSDILKLDEDKVSVNKSFFELGGDSIKIVTLKNKINEHFRCSFSVAGLFNMPTISSLAQTLSTPVADGGRSAMSQIGEEAELRDETLRLLGLD